ncbi:chemotaxis protein CheA [Xylanibacillus composti]|uniref:Chemotaxis protein CheA n=1 Tax=Xylanibacillus composti TaxID=1572762 RepID=A0A8J4M3W1_9BACL|nr:chemotaxis protein CheA [Xylanibacillus composti]
MNISELAQIFHEELEEQLQLMEEELLNLEKAGETEQAVQSLFRAAHTIKGSSAAMGLEAMKQLTHEMEQLLDGLRSHRFQLTSAMTNHLFRCMDGLKQLKDDFVAGEETTLDIAPFISRLQELIAAPAEPQSSKQAYIVKVKLTDDCPMKQVRAMVIYQRLAESVEVKSVEPDLEGVHEDVAFTHLHYAIETSMSEEDMAGLFGSMVDIEDVRMEPATLELEDDVEEEQQDQSGLAAEASQQRTRGDRKAQTVRVNVERLEHLMNLVGELVIDQTGMQQLHRKLEKDVQGNEEVGQLSLLTDHLGRVIADLQDTVMKARMLPIAQLFNRFPRMVRDLAHSLDKEIELVLEGSETELDRTLIEEIGDPLIHLIRNAVDHGIEPAAIREQAGKPRTGRLTVRAAHEDNQVVIIVEDDGAGIDPNRVRQSAIGKGLISMDDAERMSDQEAVHLIFVPGFSTASAVSEVSGRGVGMDIVRSDIERLNGLIDIVNSPGQGVQFKIRLPLTLAIITGLLVRLNTQRFVLPMSNVAEIVRVKHRDIQSMKGQEVVMIRDRVIPLLWLHDHFHIPRCEETRNSMSVVVVGTAEKRVALAVDELLGKQDIVIKSLGSFIGKVNGLSGSTILGDGRIALIMEVGDLLRFTS